MLRELVGWCQVQLGKNQDERRMESAEEIG